MFCPKCSQQQVSDETSFCSRCGFQLNVVKALLVEDGSPPALDEKTRKIDRSRRRDLTFGALFMFFCALAVMIITVDMPPSHSARIIFLVIIWMILTLLINIKPLIQYLLQPNAPAKDISASDVFSNLSTKIKNAALPPAQSIPAEDSFAPSVNTTEFASPPSVTERTTNLLENK